MTSRELFEGLYEQHAGAVKGYAMRRADPARAEDVVAEVFLVAWRRLDELPAEPRPWLFGVARRVLANERRRAARQGAAIDRLSPSAEPAEGPLVGDQALGEALANLSDTDREALLLIAWEGLKHRDAARVLGIREATFTVRLHRAKRRLARALESRAPATASTTRLETP
ncbi:MAG TPA: sigma-70 family RNA polymerase sigma factor [Solirubrobacteraceae bacterium]|jgi:RNA polymerase sigma-70 factor (ECF subfamily)|nr:sigma-70 family RNA polymerase sigma factor [Solirubrobacteraceae bacterium]